MKREFILLVFLVGIALASFGEKQYVNIIATDMTSSLGSISLSGSVPSGMSRGYSCSEYGLGEILNMLAKEGFVVEQMGASARGTANTPYEVVIMSRDATPAEGAIETIALDDGEATEVARYNMQGLPVNENERGVQIVVYSNFTAKVVIVQ